MISTLNLEIILLWWKPKDLTGTSRPKDWEKKRKCNGTAVIQNNNSRGEKTQNPAFYKLIKLTNNNLHTNKPFSGCMIVNANSLQINKGEWAIMYKTEHKCTAEYTKTLRCHIVLYVGGNGNKVWGVFSGTASLHNQLSCLWYIEPSDGGHGAILHEETRYVRSVPYEENQ